MTEAEWLACDDPTPMLEFLRLEGNDRKLRLFAVACCHRIKKARYDSIETTHLLEAIERFADGSSSSTELESIRMAGQQASILKWRGAGDPVFEAEGAVNALWPLLRVEEVIRQASAIAGYEASLGRVEEASRQKRRFRWWKSRRKLSRDEHRDIHAQGVKTERAVYRLLLQDIFNPFRPVTPDPAWQTSTAVTLARQMYDSRDFSPLPILADALQDAGCDHPNILAHCRGDGPHVRGCWVVDLVLGKE
ncbi:MAG: hypothetical protein JWO38_64 [Gemmataceae bacterium]|nr:hypothetical protein [Gemmataceae bacterium]